jgi:4'-phosphopantetheinyl transferase
MEPNPASHARSVGSQAELSLSAGAVQVYLCVPERQDPADFDLAWSVLDDSERQHAERFLFAADRHQYALAHGLLRLVLARYVARAAADLSFVRGAHGRPELLGSTEGGCVRFSLSHTRGLVGCAVTLGSDIGFDLECLRRPAPLGVAQRYFSPLEMAALARLCPEAREERFFALWTLKEAYLKGRGLGLSLPLSAFVIEPRASGEAQLTPPPDDSQQWTLRSFRLADHVAALALSAQASQPTVTLAVEHQLRTLAVGRNFRVWT